MSLSTSVRCLVIFVLIVSLLNLPHLGRKFDGQAFGNPAPNERWIPSGPSMDQIGPIVYGDEDAEFLALQTNGIDFADLPLPAPSVQTYSSDQNFYVSQAGEGSVSGLDFNMANTFWGCPFSFLPANNVISACGIDIRQGIAHLIDKSSFTTSEAYLTSFSVPVDDPWGSAIPTPNPC